MTLSGSTKSALAKAVKNLPQERVPLTTNILDGFVEAWRKPGWFQVVKYLREANEAGMMAKLVLASSWAGLLLELVRAAYDAGLLPELVLAAQDAGLLTALVQAADRAGLLDELKKLLE